ncbi:MAG: 1-acyl-sn-glycerol-3-phosphate acyltransferase [Planctomycetes bacterium]|nr:1-acyl-sn-glycerol-3-phosphate acyltransferase [Planctomycetota bacterium]
MSDIDHVLVDQTRPTGWRGWVYRTAVNLAAAMGRVLFFWKVEGIENIPREGGLLVVANHPSFLEPPSLVCIMIYGANRDLSIMAWHKLFKIPVVSFFTKTYKAYPVNRENPGRGPYQTLLHILKNGGAAGVFPEGSRSEQRLMGPWKPGALRAAFTAKATILPITFVTAGEFWPRGQWRPRFFRKHHIRIHPAETHEQYMAEMPEGMREKDWQEVVSERIREVINAPIRERLEEGRAHIEKRMELSDPLGDPDNPILKREARYEDARRRISA